MAVETVVPVLLTVLAFVLGVLVGWMWWGRSFVRARLTRDEALSILASRLERDGGDGTAPGDARGPTGGGARTVLPGRPDPGA